MEILDLIGKNNVWEVVKLDLISCRSLSLFSPINDKDLLILGGCIDKRDAFLFNVKEK